MNNQFQITDKLILTEDGLKRVYEKGQLRYIRKDTEDFVVYEVVPREAVLDKKVDLDMYPEVAL